MKRIKKSNFKELKESDLICIDGCLEIVVEVKEDSFESRQVLQQQEEIQRTRIQGFASFVSGEIIVFDDANEVVNYVSSSFFKLAGENIPNRLTNNSSKGQPKKKHSFSKIILICIHISIYVILLLTLISVIILMLKME